MSGSMRRNQPYPRQEYRYFTEEDNREIEHRVSKHLNKCYQFAPCDHLPLEHFKTPVWELKSLAKLKKDLNVVKSKLNHFMLDQWHSHTHLTNTGGLIVRRVKLLKPELPTQAWCKFYDILETFALIEPSNNSLNSVHLCEAPGAFIAALNHNLTLNHPQVKWQWRATTLNPYYEGNSLQRMINDDRFVKKTLNNWLFGEDHSGNICHRANIEHLKKSTKELGLINMVTADGSFDCTGDPAEQENTVVPLFYCETVAALNILAVGGCFVLKMFTMFECSTICLLYLLRCAFREMSIYKPIASKEGNSEVYVINKGYKGRRTCKALIVQLTDKLEEAARGKAMFGVADIDPVFLKDVQKCAKLFSTTQMEVIERNISLFHNFNARERGVLWKIKNIVADRFINDLNIQRISDDCFITGREISSEHSASHISARNETGTFAQQQYLCYTDLSARVKSYQSELEHLEVKWPVEPKDIVWVNTLHLPLTRPHPPMIIRRGKPFKSILSSRFCLGTFLDMFNGILKHTVTVVSYDYWAKPIPCIQNISNFSLELKDCKIVDVRNLPWILKYNEALPECLETLKSVLYEMQVGNSLIFLGLPLLTQFNVSLIFILARNFKEIGFAPPLEMGYCLIFQNMQSLAFDDLFVVLKDIDRDSSQQLISLVDLSAFSNKFLNLIMISNQILLKKSALMLVDMFS